MRISKQNTALEKKNYKIIAVDDETGIIDSLSVLLKRSGYTLVGCTNPLEAIEKIKQEHFDLMLLDFIMTPIHGDLVVEEIRKFNQELYIILLTGHKDLAPPLETIKSLSVQGYCEKSDKFDQLLLLIESAIKSIEQMKIITSINDQLRESQEQLENAYHDSIEIIRKAVEAKDTYTIGHSERVSEYSVLIGKYMNLDENDLYTLKIGGLFHDIGKIGIPDNILTKNGKLTDTEYAEVKNHPAIGKHILSNATVFRDIIPIVYSHHEKFNGTGYPNQLSGNDIPFLARIVSVADSFDAMTSKRSYRNAIPFDELNDEFKRCSGTQFDPQITDIFLDILNNHFDEIKNIQETFKTN